jgi:AcrR family transcriptional regulator
MSNTTTAKRGDHTRELLLDALESIAADQDIGTLSHRTIARRAGLHAALLHYHFGTVERLLEEAIARRAARLSQAQLAALSALFARGRWTIEDVVGALWRPFSSLAGPVDDGWRNYLCMIARIATASASSGMLERHFAEPAAAARRALKVLLPGADEEALGSGLRFTRMLFLQETLDRCERACPPAERTLREQRLATFAAAGLRALAGDSARATSLSVAET